MIRETVNALMACVVTFLVCAVAYPLAVYGIGHTLFPRQAEGSLIEVDGKVIGSELIAQPFSSEKYFSPRPSAAGANGYAADAASGSNLGTTNPALRDRIALESARQVLQKTNDAALKAKLERLDAVQGELKTKKEIKEPTAADTESIAKLETDASTATADVLSRSTELGNGPENRVPVDLVTTSGGGLDPHISPEAARYQADRVASARKLPIDRVLKLIADRVETSGAIIGAPARVNVLRLNLDLDKETAPAPG
jgi:K+-transporting ATPase ATPase C chain